jgi:hypothetical protein
MAALSGAGGALRGAWGSAASDVSAGGDEGPIFHHGK